MKVTLNNGESMTEEEFVRRYGDGDTMTEFVATKAELVVLADGLVQELLTADFVAYLQASYRASLRMDYMEFRLSRVMDFLPERKAAEVNEKLRVGYLENEANAKTYLQQQLQATKCDVEGTES